MPPVVTVLLAVIAAYGIGSLSPGHGLVRWRTGRDVREQGSGATGATNAGRILGRWGFAVVLLLDLAKGALAAGAAQWLAGDLAGFLAAVAAIAGHTRPFYLGFRGGPGLGPLLGAWLALAPLALLPCLLLGLAVLAFTRRFGLSGLAGLMILPAATWWRTASIPAAALAGLALGIALLAHRPHQIHDGRGLG
jgi:glycerol-3-phosphate acyltransferase PlsY